MPEKMMGGRLRCCVPFCRRTFKAEPGDPDDGEIMCGQHWRLAPKVWRRRRTRLVRLYRKRFGDNAYWHYPGGSPQRLESLQLSKLCHRPWIMCRDKAISRAMGV